MCTHCSSFGIQSIRIPCIRPTVYLICGYSLATVGLYARETVCFFLFRNPSVHWPNTNHSDSLHTSNSAFDMQALTSHCWAVCRGIVCFVLSRNPSVHRPNTSHSDSLHTSYGAFDMRALSSHCRAVCRWNHCVLFYLEIFQFIDQIQIIRI